MRTVIRFLYKRASLKRKVLDIEVAIRECVRNYYNHDFWISRYGAYDIDPKHLVYWVCIKSDRDKMYLQSNKELNDELRGILIKNDYPANAIPFVHIGFESQETVDREANGNWWHHFK